MQFSVKKSLFLIFEKYNNSHYMKRIRQPNIQYFDIVINELIKIPGSWAPYGIQWRYYELGTPAACEQNVASYGDVRRVARVKNRSALVTM